MTFHRHRWKIVNRVEHPSGLEQLAAAGATNVKGYLDLTRREVIVTYRCESCGAEKVQRV